MQIQLKAGSIVTYVGEGASSPTAVCNFFCKLLLHIDFMGLGGTQNSRIVVMCVGLFCFGVWFFLRRGRYVWRGGIILFECL